MSYSALLTVYFMIFLPGTRNLASVQSTDDENSVLTGSRLVWEQYSFSEKLRNIPFFKWPQTATLQVPALQPLPRPDGSQDFLSTRLQGQVLIRKGTISTRPRSAFHTGSCQRAFCSKTLLIIQVAQFLILLLTNQTLCRHSALLLSMGNEFSFETS